MEDIREPIRLLREGVANSKGGKQPRGIVPPGTGKSTERRHWREQEGSSRRKESSAWSWRETQRGRGQVSGGDCGGEEGDKRGS